MKQARVWNILGGEYSREESFQRWYRFIWGEEYDPNGLPPEDLDPDSPYYIKPPEGVTPENQGESSQIKPDSHKKQSVDPSGDCFDD